jgi:hypothetical protein
VPGIGLDAVEPTAMDGRDGALNVEKIVFAQS